ncbi:hypothetical protein IAT38_001162 [Cryptococcus sp. DSM 104549]
MTKVIMPTITLNDGVKIPKIGFGLGTTHFNKSCVPHVVSALQQGYTYIDCAQMYNNSTSLREALEQWGGKREDVFVVQKCGKMDDPTGEKNPRVILKQLLKDMNLEYVDLYLLHSPLLFAPKLSIAEAWAIMEELKAEGLTKSIGVSNFREEDLVELEKTWKVVPSVNQIEYHPYVYHAPNMLRLTSYCAAHNITLECYGPLSSITRAPGGPVDAPVARIAAAHGLEPSQVLLQWAAQKSGGVIVTTSSNVERQRVQLDAIVKGGKLSEEEVEEIAEAGKGKFYRWTMAAVWDTAKP